MADLSNAQFAALFAAKLKELIDGDLTVSEFEAAITPDLDSWYTLTTTAANRLAAIIGAIDGVITGSGAPLAAVGDDGSYYFDMANGGFYGPKTEGVWGTKNFDMRGPRGFAATVEVGTVTTGAAGSNASVTNSGDANDATFDFVIPKGDKGDTGTLTIGTVTALNPGDTPTVTNSGTSSAAVLNFGLPQGLAATIAIGAITELEPGEAPTVTNTGTPGAAVLAFGLPGASSDADILAQVKAEDGAGSGLDADLLDGQHGAHYLDPANHDGARAVQTASFTATHGARWPCDTSAGGFTVTLSDAVPVGKSVQLYDPAASWLSNWLRILPASGTGEIVGVTPGEPLIGDMAGVEITLTREASGWSWTSTQAALDLEIY